MRKKTLNDLIIEIRTSLMVLTVYRDSKFMFLCCINSLRNAVSFRAPCPTISMPISCLTIPSKTVKIKTCMLENYMETRGTSFNMTIVQHKSILNITIWNRSNNMIEYIITQYDQPCVWTPKKMRATMSITNHSDSGDETRPFTG